MNTGSGRVLMPLVRKLGVVGSDARTRVRAAHSWYLLMPVFCTRMGVRRS